MVSIIGHRIHFDGVKVLRGQRHVSEKKNQSKYSPPGKNDINTLSENTWREKTNPEVASWKQNQIL